MSIRRTVQLLLDRAAAKRVEKDTQGALNRGTDPRKPKRNLGTIDKAMNKLRSGAGRLLGTFVAIFAVQKVKAFARTVIESFGVQERAILRVNSALMNQGRFTEENSKLLQDHAAAIQRVTQAGDEAILDATATIGDLAKELTIGELAKAQEAAVALADTFFDGNLATAASLLAKTIGGSTNALARYAVEIDTTGTQSQKLNQILEVTEGLFLTSQRAATDYTGRNQQLRNSLGDLNEEIGLILVRGTKLTEGQVSARKAVDEFTASLMENRQGIANWGRVILRILQAVFKSITFVFTSLFNLGNVIGNALDLAALSLAQSFAPVLNKVLDLIDKIPGVDIPIRMNELTPQEFLTESDRIIADLKGNVGDLGTGLFELGDAYRDVAVAARDAALGQGEFVDFGPSGEAAAITGPALAPPVSQAELDRLAEEAEARDLRAAERRKRLADRLAEQMAFIQSTARTAAEGMTDAFQTFFEATGLGFRGQQGLLDAAGDASRKAGAAIIAGMVAGRVETEMALGTAAIASGIWPPNPAAIASGLKHFAAAALFKAIPGVVAGGGASGGGGGVGGLPRGAIGSSVPGATNPLGPEINIFIDPLSPANPDFQRVTLGAVQAAQERFGDNVKVNIHPRTGS